MATIRDCFVTGKWEADKDASKLLKEDGELLFVPLLVFLRRAPGKVFVHSILAENL